MITSNILKWCIEILFWLTLTIGGAIILMTLYSILFTDGFSISVGNDGKIMITQWYDNYIAATGDTAPKVPAMQGKDYIYILMGFLQIILFVTIIYFLRKATKRLVVNEMFGEQIIYALEKTGQFIIAYALLMGIMNQFANLMYFGAISIAFDFDGFSSSIFLIILGLFFMMISKAFEKARILKSENELTI